MLVQVERIHGGGVNYRNWVLTWPGYHASSGGLRSVARIRAVFRLIFT